MVVVTTIRSPPLIDQFGQLPCFQRIEFLAHMIISDEVEFRRSYANAFLHQREWIFAPDILRVDRKIDTAGIPGALKGPFQANGYRTNLIQSILNRRRTTIEVCLRDAAGKRRVQP